MNEQVHRPRVRSNGHPAYNRDSSIAIEVATRMSQMSGIPSVSTLAVCLTEVCHRLPRRFDEQITFLKSIARCLAIYPGKPGAEIVASSLGQITGHLEHCGEIPCYPFDVVAARLHRMSDFESRRYLAGLEGLARRDRRGGAERRLLALLNYSTDTMLPFAWSEEEWREFDRLVEESRVR